MTTFIKPLLIAVAGLALYTTEAAAEFRICNTSPYTVQTVMAYQDSDGTWMSEGWWMVAPGTCTTTIGRPLTRRYYYVWAQASGRDWVWSGQHRFCVTSERFRIYTRDCSAYNYRQAMFYEVDTGRYSSYTYTLGWEDPFGGRAPTLSN